MGSDHSSSSSVGIPLFHEFPGLTFHIDENEPIVLSSIYEWMMNEKILEETNMYGQQYIQEHEESLCTNPRSRTRDFIK